MKHPLRILAVMLALAITGGASIAYAQDDMSFNTSFAFRLGTEVYQPGTYALHVGSDLMALTITGTKGGAHVALVETLLAEPEPPLPVARVVFDKVGEVYYLSEVWIPGSDGFLLHATKGKHTHVKVTVSRKG